ncbi:alpha-N-acetylgalactosaminide alpha-2,6-sialyltransferase 2 isoform X2 [Cololabis saira]|uniref:alpha-N-acetylgalactosaminide alpha-2,6-sialyltransferase 2 isoform X2 n=1 Tax=Cololabis saira TaxID=129043 RepID=UPI002AD34754|nr:alpha-N-acetylgalactosaminide alpha-2,6-sialyltransferase 2 isoform X2 [Cololabis saira]
MSALRKKLFVGVGTVSVLLCVYFLCLTVQWPPVGSTVPLRTFHFLASRISSLQDPQGPPENPPPPAPSRAAPTPTANRPQNRSQDASGPGSKSVGIPGVGKVPQTVRPTRPAGPTEPPFIGDSYMSDDDGPRRHDCSDSIPARVRTTDFGGRFLDRLPVLQWFKHATPEQYQRLRQYPGTHGWGGLDYNTLVETLSLLNSSANRQMLDDWTARSNGSACTRCAVVGNGGILRNSQKGKEIDGHHYVFRTNGAIIKGFEQDVGARTTHYIFSTNTLMNSMRSYRGAGYLGPPVSKETRYVFLPDHDRDYLLAKAAATHTLVTRGPEKNKDPLKYFGEDVSAAKLKMFHPDFIRYLRNRFIRSNALKTKYKDIYRPSTGAAMLLAALHTCDQVSAYGFMTPDYKNYSDHYYDSKFHPVAFYINHDLRLEMALWQQLHAAGLLRLYMRS